MIFGFCFCFGSKVFQVSKYIICLMVSTDQANPSCFYFRILWILMERLGFIFFVPSTCCRASEPQNLATSKFHEYWWNDVDFILFLSPPFNAGPQKFHQYSWNSEVETTWISLIGWHHKTRRTSNNHQGCQSSVTLLNHFDQSEVWLLHIGSCL